MGTFYNPSIVKNGLVYYIDFANVKSYPAGQNEQFPNNVLLQLQGESSPIADTSKFSSTIGIGGTVTPSTTQVKFGNASIPFSTNNYLTPTRDLSQTGNFTFETWLYPVATGSQSTVLQVGSESANRIVYFLDSSSNLQYNIFGASTVALSGNFPTGAWNHLAITRSGNTLSAYKNGTLTASVTQTGILGNSVSTVVGATIGGGGPFSGYMDDFRFTSGVARTSFGNTGPIANLANPVDRTKNNYTSVIYNNPTYTGGYLSFNGTTQYMQTNLLPNSSGITVSVWFNSSTFSTASSYACLISDQIAGNPNFDIRKKNGVSNVLEASVKLSGVAEILNNLATISDNTWYNIHLTYDQTNIVGYLNGVQTFSSTGTPPLDITTTGVCIAQNPSFSGRNLSCSVSNVSIYNRGLTSAEVRQNYNAIKGRFGL